MKDKVYSDENSINVDLVDFNYSFEVYHETDAIDPNVQSLSITIRVKTGYDDVVGKPPLTKLYDDLKAMTADNKKFKTATGYRPRVIHLIGKNTVFESYGHLNFVKTIDVRQDHKYSIVHEMLFKIVAETYSVSHSAGAVRKHFVDSAIKDL